MDLLISTLISLLVREGYAWLPKVSQWLIERAVRRLPVDLQERWREEWKADSDALPNSGVKLAHALGLRRAANRIKVGTENAKLEASKRATARLSDLGIGFIHSVPSRDGWPFS